MPKSINGPNAIKTDDLTKKYGKVTAVKDLNLSVKKGETFGLLGPNGCGKTTIILMLIGFSRPTYGDIDVLGYDPRKDPVEMKSRVAYLPERVGLYGDMTSRENLQYVTNLNRIDKEEARDRIDNELENVGLYDYKDEKVESFSLGMKQRLAIASILIKNPDLILLDEPTIGLDAEGAKRVLEILAKLAGERDVTTVVCSHDFDRIRQVCNRVGVMINGDMKITEDIKSFEKMVGKFLKVEISDAKESLLDDISSMSNVEILKEEGGTLLMECDEEKHAQIAKKVIDSGVSLLGIEGGSYDLQTVYSRFKRNG